MRARMIPLPAGLFALALGWAAGPAPALAQEPVFRIGHHSALYGAVDAVAGKLGYFEKEFGKGGYTLSAFAQGTLMRQAMLARSLDVGYVSPAAFITALAKGGKLTAVGVLGYYCDIQAIMVRADSPIRSIAEIKGKRIGTAKGSTIYFNFRRFVAPAHGLAERDWVVVNMRSTERMPSLQARAVDVITEAEPAASVGEAAGIARRLDSFCKYFAPPELLVASARTLESHPDLYAKYLRAWLRSLDLFRKDSRRFTEIYYGTLEEKGKKISIELLHGMMKRVQLEPRLDGRSLAGMKRLGAALYEEKQIPRLPDFAAGEGIDPRPLARALGGA